MNTPAANRTPVRLVPVCVECGSAVDPADGCADHPEAAIDTEERAPWSVVLGCPVLAPADVAERHIEEVRAACLDGGEVAMTATRREVLDACELADHPVCTAARKLVAEVWTSLQRTATRRAA